MREQMSRRELKWSRLDNTANLFPVIATDRMTNVYRLSMTLMEDVDPGLLQQALDKILPMFDSMNVRLRTGAFWYYFETNRKKAPGVEQESEYPCRKMEPQLNAQYLFRVSYYKKRINLEVFHVLADGMGGATFLKELTCQYLRLAHPELCSLTGDHLSEQTSLNTEDSYLKNFRKGEPKGYKSQPAFHMNGEKLRDGAFGVIQGYLSVSQVKKAAHDRKVSINEYLAGVYVYSIYKEYLHGAVSHKPIVLCVPVNLRPYFESITTRNFFAMVSAAFRPDREDYTRDEVEKIVVQALRDQIKKENLEKLFSYNVSNQKNLMLRAVPLILKKFVMQWVYRISAQATTTTMTNLGVMKVDEVYRKYIRRFSAALSVSQGQNTKMTICSYGDEMVAAFCTILKDTSVQKRFFRILAEDGIDVAVESNL
ncbi:MAG: hypothetical protein MR965_05390 [Lachnospiraceae bacterium]|nr:hypothetical protein [Lachnospiraceae bacterium]